MTSAAIRDALQGLRGRLRALTVLHGGGLVVAAAVSAALLIVLADYLFRLPSAPRLLLLWAALALVGALAWQRLLRPLLARLTLGDVAARVEQVLPQFDDRLRSAVQFGDGEASPVLQARTIEQAERLLGAVDLRRLVSWRPALVALGLAASAVLAATLLAASAAPALRGIALARLIHPFGDARWPKRVALELADALPPKAAAGQTLDVRIRLARGDAPSQRVVLHTRGAGGAVTRQVMTRGDDGAYSAGIDLRLAPDLDRAALDSWVTAGDDRLSLPAVEIVPRLRVTSIVATVSPPPYVRRGAPRQADLAAAPALVSAGAGVALQVTFNKPIALDTPPRLLTPSDMPSPVAEWTLDGATAGAEWRAQQSSRFRIAAVDRDGLGNNAIEEYEIVVRPDAPPSVQIENPTRSEQRTADAVVPLQALAEDDHGIDSADLVVLRLGTDLAWRAPLVTGGAAAEGATTSSVDSGPDRERLRIGYGWRLAGAPAPLKPGDVLEYYVVAQDNFELDGARHEPASSTRLRITIISPEELSAAVIEELRRVRELILNVRAGQQRLRDQTGEQAAESASRDPGDEADRAALDRLQGAQTTVAAQTRQLAERVEQQRRRLEENASGDERLRELARDVAADLARAVEQPMTGAVEALARARQSDGADPRQAAFDQAAQRQQEAEQELARAADRLRDIGSLDETIRELGRMLDDQRDLTEAAGKLAEQTLGRGLQQLTPAQRRAVEASAGEQQALARDLQKAIEQLEKLAEQMREGDAAASQSMQKAAQAARQRQLPAQAQKAADAMSANRQAQAQAAQRQVELGLQRMLDELKETEKRRLAELRKRLAELGEQIDRLIRRQAGHNLDVLALRGDVEAEDAAETQRLRDLAGREQDAAAPAPREAVDRQEQTERNTRDIARQAGETDGSAQAASHLARAASRMSRAIFAMRESKWADAYRPPQAEALAALEAARQSVEQQQQQVEQDIEEQQREELRQKLVAVRDGQAALREQTGAVETARDAAGRLPFAAARQAAQLSPRQSGLAESMRAAEAMLDEVGSVVFLATGRDVARSMDDVAVDLAASKTGEPVQAAQGAIVARLDVMIESLAIEPRESRFAQDAAGQGGGGSGGGATLPAEAELRLLRALQVALNAQTRDAEPAPRDEARVTSLGQRQGELRGLLEDLLAAASQGKVKLGPEPDPSDPLPDEGGMDALEDRELDEMLLSRPQDDAGAGDTGDVVVERLGSRMGRARQRLALQLDPGAMTQEIQRRIVDDLDALIDESRQQTAQARNAPPGSRGGAQQRGLDQQSTAQAQNQGARARTGAAAEPAGESRDGGRGDGATDLSQSIEQSLAEWGGITPRLRQAQLEGAREHVVEEYRRFIEDYYRSLATKASERR